MQNLIKIANKVAEKIEKKVRTEDKSKFGNYVGMGADGTETQYIDKIAEDVALNIIKKEGNILSEEAGFIDNGKEYTFIVDPIDGTRNAVNGIPFYAVSVAIGKKTLNDVEYGIVKNIPTGDTYYAIKDKGAFLNGRRINVRNDGEPIYCLSLGKSGSEKTWELARKNTIRAMGAAALEMCLVASGAFSFYFIPRDILRVTDLAASTLIVREAGGEVYDAYGSKLEMPLNLEKRSSVFATSGEKEEII